MSLSPYDEPILMERRRALRKEQTVAEAKLWSCLRGRKCEGKKFVRQYSVGAYIVDFYCPDCRLVVEVDGGYHEEESVKEYDQIRTDFLRGHDMEVLRFTNDEILNSLEPTLSKIAAVLKDRAKN